jgi:biotin carboxylase
LGQHPHFVEVGHDYPAPLSAGVERIITRETTRAAKALGLSWGPAHFELRLTSSGPKIIEVNPRLAGGHIPQLVRLATGVDLIAETIRIVRGGRPGLKATQQRHASIRFIISPGEGLLTKWKGQRRAGDVPGVEDVQSYAKLGTEVSVRGDFRDRIGHIIATGRTAKAARATVDLAGALVQPVVSHKKAPSI